MSITEIPTSYSRYAPLRYEATRPFAITLGQQFALASTWPPVKRHNFIKDLMSPAIKREIQKHGPIQGPGPHQAEICNVQIFGMYERGGRVIYDFHNTLTDALLNTDADSVPLSAVSPPSESNNSLYLHFGNKSGLSHNGQSIEGAFVIWYKGRGIDDPDALAIELVPGNYFTRGDYWRVKDGEALVGVSISLKQPELGVTDAMIKSIAETEQRNKDAKAQIAAVVKEIEEKYGQVVQVPFSITELEIPLLKKGLALIVNCLLYLNTAPDDAYQDWDDRADPALVEQANHGEKPGTRKLAERTLSNRRYLKIHYIGHKYASDTNNHHISEAGRTVSMHIRRGHIRHQPYGPARSKVKLIFIPPVVVNPSEEGLPGRIFDI